MARHLKWKSFERNKILNKNLNDFSEMFYWGIVTSTPKQTYAEWRTHPVVSAMVLSVHKGLLIMRCKV